MRFTFHLKVDQHGAGIRHPPHREHVVDTLFRNGRLEPVGMANQPPGQVPTTGDSCDRQLVLVGDSQTDQLIQKGVEVLELGVTPATDNRTGKLRGIAG